MAHREKLYKVFILTLNTSAAIGFNSIDAVKVLGYQENGVLVDAHEPICETLASKDCWYRCEESQVLTNERFEATMRVVTGAVGWLGTSLRIAQMDGGRLYIRPEPNTDQAFVACGDVAVPTNLTQKGVPEGLILFVTARPMMIAGNPTDRMLPTASACRKETSSVAPGRPTVIHLNVPVRYSEEAVLSSTADERNAVDGLIHHLYRAMGWDESYHTEFVNFKGTDVVACPGSSSCIKEDKQQTWGTRYIWAMNRTVMPNLIKHARDHFHAELEYVELENGDHEGPGIQGVLLEDRIFYGELMTYPAPGKRLFRSKLSLAYLEDTGWYFPVYDAAEPLEFGHFQGREFVLDPCNYWRTTTQDAKHYTCPTKESVSGIIYDSSKNGSGSCTADRLSKGTCVIHEYAAPLDSPYWYFDNPSENHFGGLDAMRDYCPFTMPVWPDNTGSCVDTQNVGQGEYYEEYGQASRCFEVRRWEQPSQSKPEWEPGCLRHRCIEGQLEIKVGETYHECPLDGGEKTLDSERITITCPASATICDSYKYIPPSIMLNNPEPKNGLTLPSPFLNASFEVANFLVREHGEVRITVDGRVHQVWNEDDNPLNPIKVVPLRPLPVGQLVLGFHIFSMKGLELDAIKVSLTVNAEVDLWASDVRAFSSQCNERIADKIKGMNETNKYQTSQFSWAPAQSGNELEWIQIRINQTIYPRLVTVYENFGPGALRSILARVNNTETWYPLWAPRSIDVASLKPVLGDPYKPIYAFTRSQALPIASDTYRLEFAPSWVEIDAVKVSGLLVTDPSLTVITPTPSVGVLRAGTTGNHTVTVRNTGTSTLYWELSPRNWPSWVTPMNPTGEQFGEGDFDITFLLDATSMTPGNSADAINVTVVDSNKIPEGTELVAFELVMMVDFTIHSKVNRAVCYNGAVVGYSDVDQGICTCFEGAYGLACEFLRCPNNCSAAVPSVNFAPVDDLKRGMCDRYTGVCQCGDGFSGLDCSGQHGDCYVSYDGSCRAGWEVGSYTINAEDGANMNKATGQVPKAMQCNTPDEYTFGCNPFVQMQFCCRATVSASCPFFEGAAPCADEHVHCFDRYASDPTCLNVVHAYCFESPGDPACNAFRPLRVPAGYCPESLALEWCAAHPEDTVCSTVYPEQALCMFTMYNGWSPCNETACQENVLGEECTGSVVTHCQEHPEDRECDLYGYGDGCMFRPGSPPCVATVCTILPDAYDEAGCDAVIKEYCSSISVEGVDPECASQGYGELAADFPPAHGVNCPWAAIDALCNWRPETAACVQMHAVGVRMPDPSSGSFPSSSALNPEVAVYTKNSSELFGAASAVVDMGRRANRCGLDLAAQLWVTANKNQDQVLTMDELEIVIKVAAVVLRMDRRFAGTPDISVMKDMLNTTSYGQFINYPEFQTFVNTYFNINC